MRNSPTICMLLGVLLLSAQVNADSKILGTGGASPIEGGAGGGLSPWALISGYGSSGEWGGAAFATRVAVDDFQLDTAGLSVGWSDRLEISYARHRLDVEPLDLDLRQDIFGAKLRVAGALLYTDLPQISLGVQHKVNRDFQVPELLGARSRQGTDIYLTASKLFFAAAAGRNVLVNAGLRYTRGNETGLLGFGGPDDNGSLVFEGSLVTFLNDQWVLGYEYRQKPDHLDAVSEHHWQDAFVGYFPNKRFALVAAWVDLGDIAGLPDQQGWYLSLQTSL